MQNTLRGSLFALVGVFGWLAGCSAGSAEGGPEAPGDQMQIRQECEKTECELRMDNDSYACESCLDACFSASYGCDSSSACSASCSSSKPCGEWERECAVPGYEIILPNNPSPELAAACKRAISHIEECGFQTGAASACDVFAAVERPEMTAVYDCVAAISCDDLANEQAIAACQPPPSTFGDELCSTISAVCGFSDFCGDEWRLELNADGAYLRDDAKAAAFWCTEQGCDNGRDCIRAWQDFVLGWSS